METSILARQDRMKLPNGMELRLLSALEVLRARHEAETLAGDKKERALCSNACLLARALEFEGEPVFQDGAAVLAGLTVSEIAALSQKWREFDREENPGLTLGEQELENLKKKLSASQPQRLRWRVLKAFGALPSEARVKEMKDRDYLWCLLNLLLDGEEELQQLCPACRSEALEDRCPRCGALRGESTGAVNPGFDMERFQKLKEAGER